MDHGYYLRWGKIQGPLTREEWEAARRRGDISDATLVWHPGLPNWCRADHPSVQLIGEGNQLPKAPGEFAPPPPPPVEPPSFDPLPSGRDQRSLRLRIPWSAAVRPLILLIAGTLVILLLYASAVVLETTLRRHPSEDSSPRPDRASQLPPVSPPRPEETDLARVLREMSAWNHWQPARARAQLEQLEAHLVLAHRHARSDRERTRWERLADQSLALREALTRFEDLRRRMESGTSEAESLALILALDDLEREMQELKKAFASVLP